MKFEELALGTKFNTMTARWVKVSELKAECILSSLIEIGKEEYFEPNIEVLPLYDEEDILKAKD